MPFVEDAVSTDLDPTPFLVSIKEALGAESNGSGTAATRCMLFLCGQRILARVIAGAKHLAALQQAKAQKYNQWSANVKSVLGSSDASLMADIENILTGGEQSKFDAACTQALAARLAQEPVAHKPARELLRGMLLIEHQMQSEFMAACVSQLSGGNSEQSGQTDALSAKQMDRLASWLRGTFSERIGLRIAAAVKIPGGYSKQTILLTLEDTQTLPRSVIIRLDSTHIPGHSNLEDEFHIIRTLFDTGLAVPCPLALEKTGLVLGAPFVVLKRVEGAVVGDLLDASGGTRSLALDLAATLAKLHTVPVARFGREIDGARECAKDRLLRDVAAFETGWRSLHEPSVTLEIAFAWLRENAHLAKGERAIIHKDVGCHNLLAKNGKLTALLDWETAAIGHPAQDLGYLYPTIIQMCSWDEFMTAYVGAGGISATAAQIGFFELWGHTWLTVMAMQARAAFVKGPDHDVRLGYAAAYLLTRFQSRLSDALHSLF